MGDVGRDGGLVGRSWLCDEALAGGAAQAARGFGFGSGRAGKASITRSGYTLTILRKNEQGKWQIARDANMLSVEQSA